MPIFSNTAESPITLGAVHALLTQWRSQIQTTKARIPYALIMEIGSLINRYPSTLLKKTLGISHTQLYYFESVYIAAHRTTNIPSFTLSSSHVEDMPPSCTNNTVLSHDLTILPGVDTLQMRTPLTPADEGLHAQNMDVSCTTASTPCPQQETKPRFIKATYPVDAFSECVVTPTLSSYESIESTHTPEHASSSTPPPAPHMHPARPHEDAPIVVELCNQQGTTFRVNLNERQTLLFMQTFVKSS